MPVPFGPIWVKAPLNTMPTNSTSASVGATETAEVVVWSKTNVVPGTVAAWKVEAVFASPPLAASAAAIPASMVRKVSEVGSELYTCFELERIAAGRDRRGIGVGDSRPLLDSGRSDQTRPVGSGVHVSMLRDEIVDGVRNHVRAGAKVDRVPIVGVAVLDQQMLGCGERVRRHAILVPKLPSV